MERGDADGREREEGPGSGVWVEVRDGGVVSFFPWIGLSLDGDMNTGEGSGGEVSSFRGEKVGKTAREFHSGFTVELERGRKGQRVKRIRTGVEAYL